MARATLSADLGAPELQFYAEAFYQVAFRLRELIRLIPAVKSFEAVAVRDTRNWLIQHAEKPRGVLNLNYVYDIAEGFNLKPFGGDAERRPRSGLLYPDAEEFVTELLRCLDAAAKEEQKMEQHRRVGGIVATSCGARVCAAGSARAFGR